MKAFWDTNLFVYLWEDSDWSHTTRRLADRIVEGGHSLTTSALTMGELLVRPLRLGRRAVAENYRRALERLDPIPFGPGEARLFAQLRAQDGGLRAPDAMQLACAAGAGCELFFTNDDRLSRVRVQGIGRVVALADWSPALLSGN